MTTLLENPWPIWCLGGVFTLTTALIAWSRRSLGSLIALAGCALATLLLAACEHWVVTDREEVETCVVELLSHIQANNMHAVLAAIDPEAASMRRDAEQLMKRVQVDKCHAASRVRIDLAGNAEAMSATAHFRGLLNATVKEGGARGAFFDNVDLKWERRGGAWRLVSYTVYEKGKPFDATTRVR